MIRLWIAILVLFTFPLSSRAAERGLALTIYNQDFAVVRQPLELNLQEGINHVRFADTTAHLEPDSVILRDPLGSWQLTILEQNYRAEPVSESLLLSLFEGETIDFLVRDGDGYRSVPGRIVRSGYTPHQVGLQRYGRQYYATQMIHSSGGGDQPIIEVDGRLRFSLPGVPLFPRLTDDSILKPTLDWQIDSPRGGRLAAELGYVTGGMSWEASYNLVAPTEGDRVDLVGWVTMDNQSGKAFEDARIQLIAGDVSKLQPGAEPYVVARAEMRDAAKAVTEQAFDEYHLYTLERPTTLHDRETKQVEFIHATGVKAESFYVYDGANIAGRGDILGQDLRQDPNFGVEFNSRVSVYREFRNSEANQLGLPLPKGRVRFYRKDSEGQLQFTGENVIDHTPRDETVRLRTGNAFDLVGERVRTDYRVDSRGHWLDESFEIKLRNHKTEPVEIRVIERLYRWNNWALTSQSDDFERLDSRTIGFRVQVPPDGERTVTYTVHYSW